MGPYYRGIDAPLLPQGFCIGEYYTTSGREHRLIVSSERDYIVEDAQRTRLAAAKKILELTTPSHPAGTKEFTVPDGLVSLSAFLNATSADQQRNWKRNHIFRNIGQFVSSLSQDNLSLSVEGGATRHSFGLTVDSSPVLLPVGIAIREDEDPVKPNREFINQVMVDIVEHAPADDRDFPLHNF